MKPETRLHLRHIEQHPKDGPGGPNGEIHADDQETDTYPDLSTSPRAEKDAAPLDREAAT